MTGEMGWIKPNGEASDGSFYTLHAVVARALRCRLKPFDTYIGPYIDHERGKLWIGEDEAGSFVCLWPGGVAPAFCDPIVAYFCPEDSVEMALVAARDVLRRVKCT